MHRKALLIGIACWLGTCAGVSAAALQEERFREREVLDPRTTEWVPSQPSPADEPLDLARRWLAEDQPRKARKLLKGWVKENGDHEHYYDGVFLLGEAYFECKDFWKAAEQYQIVMDNTAGEMFYLAVRRTMDVGRAFLSGEKRIVWRVFRLPAYDEGIELLDGVWERVPGTRLGETALKIKADYFFEAGEMENAGQEYALLAREYPNGRYARLAMLRSAESAEASFPGVKYSDQALLEADELYRRVLDAYPEYARREAVETRMAGIRETRADKDLDIGRWYVRAGVPDAGAYYYQLVLRDWPETAAAQDAAGELRALGYDVETHEESRP